MDMRTCEELRGRRRRLGRVPRTQNIEVTGETNAMSDYMVLMFNEASTMHTASEKMD